MCTRVCWFVFLLSQMKNQDTEKRTLKSRWQIADFITGQENICLYCLYTILIIIDLLILIKSTILYIDILKVSYNQIGVRNSIQEVSNTSLMFKNESCLLLIPAICLNLYVKSFSCRISVLYVQLI